MPGLWLQKLTTWESTENQLQVAIAAMEAVLAEEGDYGEGPCDEMGRIKRFQRIVGPIWYEDAVLPHRGEEGK